MKTMKAWAAGVSSGVIAMIIQWLTSPDAVAVAGQAATAAGGLVTDLINAAVVAVGAWLVTYASPKNAS